MLGNSCLELSNAVGGDLSEAGDVDAGIVCVVLAGLGLGGVGVGCLCLNAVVIEVFEGEGLVSTVATKVEV